MPKFQQRHYEAIARVMLECKPRVDEFMHETVHAKKQQWDKTTYRLQDMFEQDNRNFNRTKFLNACEGVDTNAVAR